MESKLARRDPSSEGCEDIEESELRRRIEELQLHGYLQDDKISELEGKVLVLKDEVDRVSLKRSGVLKELDSTRCLAAIRQHTFDLEYKALLSTVELLKSEVVAEKGKCMTAEEAMEGYKANS